MRRRGVPVGQVGPWSNPAHEPCEDTIYWQAREISGIAAASDFPFDSERIRHVSPIEWKNVILCGEIRIDSAKLRMHSA